MHQSFNEEIGKIADPTEPPVIRWNQNTRLSANKILLTAENALILSIHVQIQI
jgi:hypothetical protein